MDRDDIISEYIEDMLIHLDELSVEEADMLREMIRDEMEEADF